MNHRHRLHQIIWRLALLALPAFLVIACSSADEPAPTATAIAVKATDAPTDTPTTPPSPMVLPTDRPSLPPAATTPTLDTPTPAPPPTPVSTDTPAAIATMGQTTEGLYFRGSPDPTALTVIDYSDFL